MHCAQFSGRKRCQESGPSGRGDGAGLWKEGLDADWTSTAVACARRVGVLRLSFLSPSLWPDPRSGFFMEVCRDSTAPWACQARPGQALPVPWRRDVQEGVRLLEVAVHSGSLATRGCARPCLPAQSLGLQEALAGAGRWLFNERAVQQGLIFQPKCGTPRAAGPRCAMNKQAHQQDRFRGNHTLRSPV